MKKINIGKLSDKKLSEKMGKSFNITSVCREDITRFISKKEALKMTDEEIEQITSEMADNFCDCCYWEALKNAIEKIKS